MKHIVFNLAAAASAVLLGTAAHAGPIIIDGTDSGDHGSATATANVSGWEYMQRALENLGGSVTTTAAKVVTVVGTASGQGLAYDSINSAFTKSSLVGSGWTINYVNGVAPITSFFSTLSTATTGLLYLSTYGNVTGDLDAAELAVVNANAGTINKFVTGAGNAALGGALFAQGESGAGAFGWLSTLSPGIIATDVGGSGINSAITLTPAGASAFPLLTNADLAGASPWHDYFSGSLGGLSVLGVSNDGSGVSRNLILGGGAGTLIGCGQPGQQPCVNAVPEPGSLALFGAAALAFAGLRRRKSKTESK